MNKRRKLLGNGEVSLVEILLHKTDTGEKLENHRKLLSEKEVEGCTFKP